jgi:ribonuclease E
VLDGNAYAELVSGPGEAVEDPITAEALAEKPTRARRSRAVKPKPKAEAAEAEAAEAVAAEPDVEEPTAEAEEGVAEEQPKRKKTRRGSRGGRRRKKKPVVAEANDNGEPAQTPVLIHVPDPELGAADVNGETADGAQPKKKRTRRGSRGGRRRRKPAGAKTDGAETASDVEKPLVD